MRPPMAKLTAPSDLDTLPASLRFVFAPLVKRAMGMALGVALGGSVCLLTLVHLALGALGITAPAGETPESGNWLWLLAQFFRGYEVSLGGAFIGLFWGFWAGFVMGWFLAFFRNFLVATWLIVIKTRARLAQDRDFLDHM
jgi:hypothetical protein